MSILKLCSIAFIFFSRFSSGLSPSLLPPLTTLDVSGLAAPGSINSHGDVGPGGDAVFFSPRPRKRKTLFLGRRLWVEEEAEVGRRGTAKEMWDDGVESREG